MITYILSDHSNAALFNSNDPCCNQYLADVPIPGKGGPYGLRLDWLADTPFTLNQGPTFSVSSGLALVNLDWDDSTNTMTIYGKVRHNTTGALWDVFYELSGGTVVSTTDSGSETVLAEACCQTAQRPFSCSPKKTVQVRRSTSLKTATVSPVMERARSLLEEAGSTWTALTIGCSSPPRSLSLQRSFCLGPVSRRSDIGVAGRHVRSDRSSPSKPWVACAAQGFLVYGSF